MKKCGVYKILNIKTGDFYIGQSKNISARRGQHFSSLRNNIHVNNHLQAAWNKYGEGNFIFSVILLCENYELNYYEQALIDFYRPTYNILKLVHADPFSAAAIKKEFKSAAIRRQNYLDKIDVVDWVSEIQDVDSHLELIGKPSHKHKIGKRHCAICGEETGKYELCSKCRSRWCTDLQGNKIQPPPWLRELISMQSSYDRKYCNFEELIDDLPKEAIERAMKIVVN